MKYKVMRMICMFDLPVETEEEKKAYRCFRIPIAWIVIDSDIVTVFCKTFCDTSTDALRCTGNQCGCHRRNHPFCVSCLSVEQRFSLSHHFLNHFCTRLHIVYHAGNQTAQERAFFDVAVHNCLSQ